VPAPAICSSAARANGRRPPRRCTRASRAFAVRSLTLVSASPGPGGVAADVAAGATLMGTEPDGRPGTDWSGRSTAGGAWSTGGDTDPGCGGIEGAGAGGAIPAPGDCAIPGGGAMGRGGGGRLRGG
jgi:hypothetical protein